MGRTGMFPSKASFETFALFGAVEALSFDQWWNHKGRQSFGLGEFSLTPDCLVQYQAEQENFKLSFSFSAQTYPGHHGFARTIDLARSACTQMLSMKPVLWPFFKSRISPAAIFRSLYVFEACSAVGRRGQFKLYEIGERLKLSRAVSGQPGDGGLVLADKRVAMGKLVSSERKRGLALTLNAASGIFPSYAFRR